MVSAGSICSNRSRTRKGGQGRQSSRYADDRCCRCSGLPKSRINRAVIIDSNIGNYYRQTNGGVRSPPVRVNRNNSSAFRGLQIQCLLQAKGTAGNSSAFTVAVG